MTSWFELVSDDSFQQGDFLFDCPLLPPSDWSMLDEPSGEEGEIRAVIHDLIVLTQSCDLVAKKVETVLACPHFPLDVISTSHAEFKQTKVREDVRRGNVPGYHMLAECGAAGFESGIRIVNFRQIFSLPFEYARKRAQLRRPGLRLRSPYREHLSQAFARFFMRVGLPSDIPPFK